MNQLKLNLVSKTEFPTLKMEIPIPSYPIPGLNISSPLLQSNVDICQNGVKNSNDFSREIDTSGGIKMFDKARLLF